MNERVVISGASGLVGSALARSYLEDGVEVTRLVRRAPRHPHETQWSPGAGPLDPAVLAGASAVINLNGASIGRLPWTRGYRETIMASRLQPTRTLATALRAMGSDAPMFVSASAVGFYGDRPGEPLDERSAPGSTFLARVCEAWEQEAEAAGSQATVSLLRTAPILHPRGVLKPMMLLTKLGLSGPLGTGRQIWPWISLEDEIRAIRHIVDRRIAGPVNLSGPELMTANAIGRRLARRLRRPFWLPAPSWALRLGLSRDAADSLLLSDAAVSPTALAESGFEFSHPTAGSAIEAALPA